MSNPAANVLARLQYLKDHGPVLGPGDRHFHGICHQVGEAIPLFLSSEFDSPHSIRHAGRADFSEMVDDGMFHDWEHFSGCSVYPIPGSKEQEKKAKEDWEPWNPSDTWNTLTARIEGAEYAFDNSDRGPSFWDRDTEYGALRWNLVDHCINWLKDRA